MSRSVFQVRVSGEERAAWAAAAEFGGVSVSEWLRGLARDELERVRAEVEERESRVTEQARVRQATAGWREQSADVSCDHVSPGAFCYECGRKVW